MDFKNLLFEVVIPFSILGLSFGIFFNRIHEKRREIKGWFAEKVVDYYLRNKLDASECLVHHDVLLKTNYDGKLGTTQIDHVVIAPSGIYVIETKAYGGKTKGRRKDLKWTTLYGFRKKFTMQNPYNQNYKHIKVLSESLEIPIEKFKNTIFFFGDFKSEGVDGLYHDLNSFFINFRSNKEILIEDVQLVSDLISDCKLENTRKNKKAHIKHVNQIKAEKKRKEKKRKERT